MNVKLAALFCCLASLFVLTSPVKASAYGEPREAGEVLVKLGGMYEFAGSYFDEDASVYKNPDAGESFAWNTLLEADIGLHEYLTLNPKLRLEKFYSSNDISLEESTGGIGCFSLNARVPLRQDPFLVSAYGKLAAPLGGGEDGSTVERPLGDGEVQGGLGLLFSGNILRLNIYSNVGYLARAENVADQLEYGLGLAFPIIPILAIRLEMTGLKAFMEPAKMESFHLERLNRNYDETRLGLGLTWEVTDYWTLDGWFSQVVIGRLTPTYSQFGLGLSYLF
jgi:hypothetical protein